MTTFEAMWPTLATAYLTADGAKADGTAKHPIPATAHSALAKAHKDGADIDMLIAQAKELAAAPEPEPKPTPAPKPAAPAKPAPKASKPKAKKAVKK